LGTLPPKVLLSEAVKTSGDSLPNRYVLHAVEGFGKTSLAAKMPKPIFLMSKGETGLLTLIGSGLLPTDIPRFEETQDWLTFIEQLKALRDQEHSHKTLVLDALNGFERLNHEHVCATEYGGEWGDKGFTSYMRGYEVSLGSWREMLNLLDDIRAQKKMIIFALCHTKVKPFKNPEGPDYDRYTADMHEKTWGLTHKWADAVLFGNFETVVRDENAKKSKASMAAQSRILYTERRAAWDAKNRNGLAPEIDLGNSPDEAFQAFKLAISTRKPEVSQ